jgi:hypothetical protein
LRTVFPVIVFLVVFLIVLVVLLVNLVVTDLLFALYDLPGRPDFGTPGTVFAGLNGWLEAPGKLISK